MLLQAIIGVCLETLEDFSIGSLDLSITLWMSNGRITDLDAKIFTVSLKCTAGELGSVVGDDPIRYPEPTDNGLYKLECGILVDLDHRGYFCPIGELVNGDVQIPESSDGPGQQTQDVQPPHNKRP
jgi:hypothetical protein